MRLPPVHSRTGGPRHSLPDCASWESGKAVEDSSGNAGASVAAYCAKAGVEAVIFAPDSAPAAKLTQIEVYGADLQLIPGARENATNAARDAAQAPDTAYASHNLHPYFIEGTKTFAYEVLEGFVDNGVMPDHVVIPVGNGSLYLGAAKGFRELAAAGFEFASPRLHLVAGRGVRAAGRSRAGRPGRPHGRRSAAHHSGGNLRRPASAGEGGPADAAGLRGGGGHRKRTGGLGRAPGTGGARRSVCRTDLGRGIRGSSAACRGGCNPGWRIGAGSGYGGRSQRPSTRRTGWLGGARFFRSALSPT